MTSHQPDSADPYQAPYPAGTGDTLALPLYGATFGQAWSRFFGKYATFRGRASRSEFWWYFLGAFVINVVLKIIDVAGSGGVTEASQSYGSVGDIIGYLWGLAVFIPGLAVGVRRLHDTNRSGWWILIALIPLVGTIIMLVFWAGAENPDGARFD